jgi:hypothetical protein
VHKLIFLLIVIGTSCALSGCASKKPSAHIYDGDGPTIRMAPSKAGGPQSVY